MLVSKNYSIIGDQHITHKSINRAVGLFDLVEAIGLPGIWLGDLLDNKEIIKGKCLNLCIAYFKRSKLHHYVIVGNHDYFNLDCKEHSLEALKLLPNVTVVDKITMISPTIVAIPYFHDRDKLLKVISAIQDPSRTLIAHLEVDQFDFGNGHICTNGLPLKALAGFKRVISGHFHKYQESENLTFLGTPFSHSQGEANQTKYIGMYNGETNELKIAPTPFPRHVSIEINVDAEDNGEVDQILDELDESNFNRIILVGTQANIDLFSQSIFERFNVKFISRPTDFIDNDATISDLVSNERQFEIWAQKYKKMDDETIKLGLAIMEACK